MLLLVVLSAEMPYCNSTNISAKCSSLIDKKCNYEQEPGDYLPGRRDVFKKLCATDCGKQYEAANECMSKIPDAGTISRVCLYRWNNDCNAIGDDICDVSEIDYWISKGYNDENQVLSDLGKGFINLPCTECEKQSILYKIKYEEFSNSLGSNKSATAVLKEHLESTCGNDFFNNISVDTEKFSIAGLNSSPISNSAIANDSVSLQNLLLLSILLPGLIILILLLTIFYFRRKPKAKLPGEYVPMNTAPSKKPMDQLDSRNTTLVNESKENYYVSRPS
eukprot:NODE_51_length_27121_cov_0.309452.p7 type:complete len:278 gc:universal NODE_51_length_27121_cov_0.309452:11340-10507(-)